MSMYRGTISCSECCSENWVIDNWDTYLSVTCAKCGHKAGELARGGRA